MTWSINLSNLTEFQKLPYSRPDMDKLSDAFRRCRLRLRLSMSAHAAADAVRELQPALINFFTSEAIARNRHDRKITDEAWQSETIFFDSAMSQVQAWTQETYAALTSSRFADELEAELGDGLFREARMLSSTVNDRMVADLGEENRLESAYVEKISEIRVKLNGREHSLTELEPYLQSSDKQMRRSSHRALCRAFEENHEWLDACFDQLVNVRRRMSRKLGYESFTELGYKRMGRVDYGRSEIEKFRQMVIKYIVPVCLEIRRLQRNRLDLPQLSYWDLPVLLPGGNPAPVIPRSRFVELVGRQISDLLGESEWLSKLAEYGYIDLEARLAKAGGGYCETLYKYKVPVIFTNATSTADDIATLIHEAGHAYAALASMPGMRVIEDQRPPMDVCEIHSTALEFLTMPLLDSVFGLDTQTASMIHLTESLLFLPYACLVDHFQHEIYDHPELNADERHALWRDLEKLYQPDVDYGDDEWFANGGSWQKKEHIYTAPFYYIDYALANIAALDLWQTAIKDREKAVKRYKRLCSRGNRGTLIQQLEESGIASPFDEGTFKRLVYAVCDYLSL